MAEVTLEDKQPEILRAIEFAKSKGATAVKVELEATLHRYSDDTSSECDRCDEGQVGCPRYCDEGLLHCDVPDCDHGQVPSAVSGMFERCPAQCDEGYVACEELGCEDGYVTCPECDGDYSHAGDDGGSWDDERSLNFILDELGIPSTSRTFVDGGHADYAYDLRHNPRTPTEHQWLQYAEFYNDGSVDSEVTFTVRLDNPDNVLKILTFIDAFNTLATTIGRGMETDGAGMHIAWIFSANCVYPSYDEFSEEEMTNFRVAINQMMPALYFLAAPANGKNWTRGFRYRSPEVSGRKYSAIHIGDGALEYRVFDTCYDTPEQVIDHIVVMSNTLKYLTRRYTGPRLHHKQQSYSFGNDKSRTLDRLYYEENNLDLLYQHLDKLKPKYYTMNQLRKQRGMTVTKSVIKRKKNEVERNATLAWKEFEDRWKIVFDIQSDEVKFRLMRKYVEAAEPSTLARLTPDSVAEAVKEKTAIYLERLQEQRPTMKGFIDSHVKTQLREISSEYEVSLRR